ncbi:MAG TPA: MarR family winged helix-turn-helix transcriptional regulator [Alphaproteobacteria bacterium]|nr:MarR family winged helix-turn-helix transcriptional regulator [Alphaproteobacteria bacterium]
MTQSYHTTVFLIERLHRRFLDVIKAELDRLGIEDINNVQALILFNIGKDELTVGELTARGYYLGSNVSYNVKKMVETGYLAHQRSIHDRRSIRLSLTEKGLKLYAEMSQIFDQQIHMLGDAGIGDGDLRDTIESLEALEQFWTKLVTLASRGVVPAKAASAA